MSPDSTNGTIAASPILLPGNNGTTNSTAPPITLPDTGNNSTAVPPVKTASDLTNHPTMENVGKRPTTPMKKHKPHAKKEMLSNVDSFSRPSLGASKTKRSSVISGFSLNFNRPSISSSYMSPSSSSKSTNIKSKTTTTKTKPNAQSSNTGGASTSSTGSGSAASSSGSSSSSPSSIKRIQPQITKALRKLRKYMPKKKKSISNNSKMIGQPVKHDQHRPSSTTKANSEHFNRPSVSSSDFSPSSSSSTGGSSTSLDGFSDAFLPTTGGKTVKRVTPNNSTLITTVFNPQKEWSSSSTEVITQIIKKTLIRSHVHRNHLIAANGTMPLENINGTSPDLHSTNHHKKHDYDKPNNNTNDNSYTYSSST